VQSAEIEEKMWGTCYANGATLTSLTRLPRRLPQSLTDRYAIDCYWKTPSADVFSEGSTCDAPPAPGLTCVPKVLGWGSYALVSEATRKSDGARVAIKMVATKPLHERSMLNQLYGEVELQSVIHHRNVVRLYEYIATHEDRHQHGRPDSYYFMVQELCLPQNLGAFLAKTRTGLKAPFIPQSLACWFVGQVLEGVAAIHEAGAVHRDLKPDNFMCAWEWYQGGCFLTVKITDFGWAAKQGEEWCGMAGTVEYAAPEVVNKTGQPYGQEVDIFSIGILLFELLLNHNPFRGHSSPDRVFQIVNTRGWPERVVKDVIATKGVRIPNDAQKFLCALLQFTPSHRPTARGALEDPFTPGHTWLRANYLDLRDKGPQMDAYLNPIFPCRHPKLSPMPPPSAVAAPAADQGSDRETVIHHPPHNHTQAAGNGDGGAGVGASAGAGVGVGAGSSGWPPGLPCFPVHPPHRPNPFYAPPPQMPCFMTPHRPPPDDTRPQPGPSRAPAGLTMVAGGGFVLNSNFHQQQQHHPQQQQQQQQQQPAAAAAAASGGQAAADGRPAMGLMRSASTSSLSGVRNFRQVAQKVPLPVFSNGGNQ